MNTMLCDDEDDDDNQMVMCEVEAAEALTGLASNSSSTMRGGALGSGRQSQRGKSEAEKEAQRRRRILANRESARKTIRQRQAAKIAKIEKESKKSVQVPENTPIFPYNHPSIVPFLWLAIEIQGSSQSNMAISSQFPIPMRDNILSSFQDQEHP
ncbi:Hypothetical predicted protein [Olea europaea subsp. europaea]|uniref:BZIP domain-containing protein n=1 Tax=Olea europaea subsp. europaea TaxID=158383 RepID=A0A8S0TDN4_OLEEU|nr:Hypothetical predicted protein [Olea europaea subsp. europaea]